MTYLTELCMDPARCLATATFLAAACSLQPTLANAQARLTDEASIDGVIASMTLEEKAKFVAGTGMNNAAAVPGAAGSTLAIPRLGIPQLVFADGPVGVRLGAGPTGGTPRYATAFPISSAMAATWDEALINRAAVAMGDECKAFGVDVLLAPALNIQRDPLNGRNFEYFSEDPHLAGKVTAAYVKGLQSRGVGATIKHFVANNQETQRQTINEVISERALRELYFPAFEIAVKEAHPWAVMSSYPSINGTFASQSRLLLRDVLRTEWGFDGFVMSDWFAVKDPVAALPAGNDLIMPGGALPGSAPFQGGNFPPDHIVLEALKAGTLSEKAVDDNIRAILRVVVKSAVFKGNMPSGTPDLAAHAPLAREVATDGMVLLKNAGQALPLAAGTRLAMFGANARAFLIGGGGSAEVNADPRRVVTLIDGLQQAGFVVVKEANGKPLLEGMADEDVVQVARQSDVAIISIGRGSTEGADRYSMEMHPQEIALIRSVSQAYRAAGKRVVALLNIGAPVEMQSWEGLVDAVLLTWQPGQEAGNAVADVLRGAVSPSGKLPMTIPKHYRDVPSHGNFPGYNGTVVYGEGIYVGYRHYDTRGVEPLYPFGHGLSYTHFVYGRPVLDKSAFDLDGDAPLTVSVDVRNAGDVAGKEVVQLYVRDEASRLDRPMQELKGYRKVSLKPGETRTVSFTLDKRALSAYDPARREWIAEPGRFTLRIGSSSRDIRAEVPFKAVGNAAVAIGLATPWIEVQTYREAATIVARYIGDDAVNAWIWGAPTLGDKLNEWFDSVPALKGDTARREEIRQRVLAELREL